jgi:hypothetical protein
MFRLRGQSLMKMNVVGSSSGYKAMRKEELFFNIYVVELVLWRA